MISIASQFDNNIICGPHVFYDLIFPQFIEYYPPEIMIYRRGTMKTIGLFIISVILISAVSCTRTANKDQAEAGIDQLVLFQQSFVNYAWGYQNRGWFIDRDGYMKAYRISGRGDQWHRVGEAGPDSGYIAQAALEQNYALADRVIIRIPQKELQEMYRLIPRAADGPYSPRTRTAYDAGAVMFCAYLLDKDKGMYRQVLISISGDFSQFNENAKSQEVEKWLVGLNRIYADSLAGK